MLAWAAWQLQFSPAACGTLRKHVTKPFPQPTAPDCILLLFRDSLNNVRFHVSKRVADQPFQTSPDQLEQLRSRVQAKVLAFVPVNRNKVNVTVDSVKPAQMYYFARISFSSGEAGICVAPSISQSLKFFVLGGKVLPVIGSHVRACIALTDRPVFGVIEARIRAELNKHAASGINSKLKVMKGGDVAARVELNCELVDTHFLFDIMEKINVIVQGQSFSGNFVKKLTAPANWKSYAEPVAKECGVAIRQSGTVADPKIRMFGDEENIREAMNKLRRFVSYEKFDLLFLLTCVIFFTQIL